MTLLVFQSVLFSSLSKLSIKYKQELSPHQSSSVFLLPTLFQMLKSSSVNQGSTHLNSNILKKMYHRFVVEMQCRKIANYFYLVVCIIDILNKFEVLSVVTYLELHMLYLLLEWVKVHVGWKMDGWSTYMDFDNPPCMSQL